MARNTGKKSKATDFAVRPVDTVQQRAHARDKRLMIIYGVGSVLYVVLFVAAFWGFYRFVGGGELCHRFVLTNGCGKYGCFS